jgi:pimeloyl-ACP methyl ester carboxylesterase
VQLDSLNKYCRYGCELVSIHGSGHYPMLEKPAEFNAALEKIMADISIQKNKSQ